MFLEIFEFLTTPGLQARFEKVVKKWKVETQRRRTHTRIPREIRARPQPQQHYEIQQMAAGTQKEAQARSDPKVAVLCEAVNKKRATFEGRVQEGV